MIIPVGKNRLQVNQGGYKNETIFNSRNSMFNKIAITGEDLQVDAAEPESPSRNPALDKALGEGSNPGMRQDGDSQIDKQNAAAGVSPAAPAAPATPTNPQNIVQELDWDNISVKINKWVKEVSNGAFEMKAQQKGKAGEYTITFGPIGMMRG